MSNIPKMPTAEQFASIDRLDFDPIKGILLRDGKEVGSKRYNDGRYIIDIYANGSLKRFMRYHVLWYKYYGVWPSIQIDHEDRNEANDSIGNLREKSQSGNMFNSDCGVKKSLDNPLPKGVHRYKNGRYRAYINVEGKEKHLGYFTTPEGAHNIRREAELKYYGEYSK